MDLGSDVSARPTAADRLVNPQAVLTRSDLAELGLERRAIDAVFSACPVVVLPGRWIEVPPVLFEAVTALVARDDRTPDRRAFQGFGSDRFRTAIGRACTAAGVPAFSPHDLRHRRVSLLHLGGMPWARIGELVGHGDLVTTAARTRMWSPTRQNSTTRAWCRERPLPSPYRDREASARRVRALIGYRAANYRATPHAEQASDAAASRMVLPSVLPWGPKNVQLAGLSESRMGLSRTSTDWIAA